MKKEEGFHIICGTGPKNGIWDNTKERIEKGHILDLTGLNNLLVADIDYFIKHHKEILKMVKGQIEGREERMKKK